MVRLRLGKSYNFGQDIGWDCYTKSDNRGYPETVKNV